MNQKLEYVIGQLAKRHQEKQLTRLSELVGKHRRTLYRIMLGKNVPSVETLDTLYDELRASARRKVL